MSARADSLRILIKAIAFGALALMAVLAVGLVLFLLPPVRGRLLTEVLRGADARLPGNLSAERVDWPSLGTLRGSDILWTEGGDTLVALERFAVSVELSPLLRRNVRVSGLTVENVSVDLPGIGARLPTDRTREEGETRESRRKGFPREGSIPGLPSVSVGQLRLTARSVRLAPSTTIGGVELRGRLDFTRGNPPFASLDRLRAQGREGGWRVDDLALDLDLAGGRMSGRGSGSVAPDWPLSLSISTTGQEAFRLLLTEGQGERPPGRMGLVLDGKVIRDDGRFRALVYDASLTTPGTEALSRLPALAHRLEGLPKLEGLELSGRGSVEIEPRFSTSLSVDLHANSWVEGGRVDLVYAERGLVVDSLGVQLPDLNVAARAEVLADTIRARSRVRVRGTRWLRILRPGATAPDSLNADLSLFAEGPKAAPRVEAALEARMRSGAFALDRLSVRAEVPGRKDQPSLVQVRGRAHDLVLAATAEIERTPDWTVRLTPVVIEDAARAGARGAHAPPFSGLLRYRPGDGSLAVENLQILGPLGDVRVDGRIDRDQESRFEVQGKWPEPPLILTRALELRPGQRDSLSAGWRQSGPFGLTFGGDLDSRDPPGRMTCRGAFRLPGPETLAAILPPNARVNDLGPVEGRFTILAGTGADLREFDLVLDLTETAWLDTAEIALAGRGSRIDIEEVTLALEGLELGVSGSGDAGIWNLQSEVTIADATLLRRFAPALDESLDLAVLLRADFQGTPEAPDLSAVMEGSVRGGSYQVPRLAGRARWSRGALALSAEAPDGIVAGPLRLDSLSTTYHSEADAPSWLPGWVTLKAQGPDVAWFQRLRVEKGEGWDILGDTLAVHLEGRDLRTSRPFRLGILPRGEGLRIGDLDLTGELGRVWVGGFAGPDSSDLEARVSMRFPDEAPFGFVPADLWPHRVDVWLRAVGRDRVRSTASLQGFGLGDRDGLEARLSVEGAREGILGEIAVLDRGISLLAGECRLPGSVSLYPAQAQLREGPLFAKAVFSGFPLPTGLDSDRAAGPSGRTAQLDGEIRLGGTTREPSAYAKTQVFFPGWPKLSNYAVNAEAFLGREPGSEESPRPEAQGPASKGLGGAEVTFSLDRLGRPLLGGTVTYPLAWSLLPSEPVTPTPGTLKLRVDSEDVPLAEFDPLVPQDLGLGGTVQIHFSAAGAPEDPDLEGRLVLSDVRVAMADGTWIVADGDLRFSGTGKRPSVAGGVDIQKGVIRIPDPPKNLHPVEGSSALWEVVGGAPGSTGEVEIGTRRAPERKTALGEGPEAEIDVDVGVRIPSGLWIRGQGLEVELAGELQVVHRGGYPTVTGRLNALRGHLDFLGRVFDLERGHVTFYGDDEMNPSLDLALSSRIEATEVRILLQGTVRKPQLILASEPEMNEGDIMSLVLFGRPLDELNTDQANLVQRRAADIAAAFGTAQLEARIARQLGVDVVSIQRAKGEDRRRSLVLGKYVSRRALLKYEQALEEWGSFFVNLEYFLTEQVKVETLIGRQSQSALEVNWTRDY